MITITKYPESVVLAGNKVLVNATGTKMYSTTGQNSIFKIRLYPGAAITEGSSVTLAWGNKTVPIVFSVANPDNSPFIFSPTLAINQYFAEYFNLFLKSIYQINEDFVVTLAELVGVYWFITLTAREKGSEFTITATPDVNLSFVNTQAGTDAVIRSGYQHIFQLYDITGQLIGEEAITPDASQKSVFDASEYLYNKLELNRAAVDNFSFPVDEDKIFERSAQALRFYVRYAEKWDQQVQTLYTAATCTALMGGLSKLKETEFAAYGTTFYQMLTEDKFFLTWQPVTKRTSLNAPERLYYFAPSAGQIYIRSKVYFYDGTTANVLIGYHYALSKTVYEIDCSGIVFPSATSPIEKYEIWLSDIDENILSEIRTFIIDHTFYRNEQHFIFRNSLGGYDTVRCTGRLKRQGEIDRETFTDDDNYRHSLNNVMEITYTAETGSISAEMFRWLDDLMLSKEAWWLTGGRALPVIITNKKSTELVDDQRRFNISFDFSLSALETYSAAPSTRNAVLEELTGNNNGNINA